MNANSNKKSSKGSRKKTTTTTSSTSATTPTRNTTTSSASASSPFKTLKPNGAQNSNNSSNNNSNENTNQNHNTDNHTATTMPSSSSLTPDDIALTTAAQVLGTSTAVDSKNTNDNNNNNNVVDPGASTTQRTVHTPSKQRHRHRKKNTAAKVATTTPTRTTTTTNGTTATATPHSTATTENTNISNQSPSTTPANEAQKSKASNGTQLSNHTNGSASLNGTAAHKPEDDKNHDNDKEAKEKVAKKKNGSSNNDTNEKEPTDLENSKESLHKETVVHKETLQKETNADETVDATNRVRATRVPPVSVEELEARAQAGDLDAQNDLAVSLYHDDHGVEQAREWWTKAAHRNHALAQYNLGVCCWELDQDFTQAVHWYQQASDQGNVWATVNLAQCWETGVGVKEACVETAMDLYTRAAQQGSGVAQTHLLRLVHQQKQQCPTSVETATTLEKKSENGTDEKKEPYSNEKKKSVLLSDTLLPFRDGVHHTGQATWQEIQQGLEDGELSQETLVYWEDAWVEATALSEDTIKTCPKNTVAFQEAPVSPESPSIVSFSSEPRTAPTKVATLLPSLIQLPRMASFKDGLRHKAALSDLEAWTKLALILDGRDKITKVLQYTSRLLAWCYLGSQHAERFEIMKTTLSNSRKAFRLGRTLIELQRFKAMGFTDTLQWHWKRTANGEADTNGDESNPPESHYPRRPLLRRISTNIGLTYWDNKETLQSMIRRQSSVVQSVRRMSSRIYRLSVLESFREPDQEAPEKPLWHVCLAAIKILGLATYFAGDNVSFLSTTGFCDNFSLPTKERAAARKRFTSQVSRNGNRAYFVSALAGLVINWRSYRDFCRRINQRLLLEEEDDDESSDMLKAKEKQFTYFLSLVKSCCDVLVFSNNPGIDLWNNTLGIPLHEGVHCAAGLVSASTVLCSNFPSKSSSTS